MPQEAATWQGLIALARPLSKPRRGSGCEHVQRYVHASVVLETAAHAAAQEYCFSPALERYYEQL
jgi:hypothetical protein